MKNRNIYIVVIVLLAAALLWCLYGDRSKEAPLTGYLGAQLLEDPAAEGLSASDTHFEGIDGVTVDTSSPVTMSFVGDTEGLSLEILDPSSGVITVTVKGLAPDGKYYLYNGDYHNYLAYHADISGTLSFTHDLATGQFLWLEKDGEEESISFLAPAAHAAAAPPLPSTLFLDATDSSGHCALVGTWDTSTKTCTLTVDVASKFQVDSNGITLDCAAHKITGPGFTFSVQGVLLPAFRNDVTVRNCEISGFARGIQGIISSRGLFEDNTLTKNVISGITLSGGDDNIVRRNTSSDNVNVGLDAFNVNFGMALTSVGGFFVAERNTFEDNTIFNMGKSGFITQGPVRNNTISNNTITKTGFRGALTNIDQGMLFLSGANNNTISGNTVTDVHSATFRGSGVVLRGNGNTLSNNTISDVGFRNISMVNASGNTLTGNILSDADVDGITLVRCNDNIIADNDVSDWGTYGIQLSGSGNASPFTGSSRNTITGNKLRRTAAGFGGGMFLNFGSNDNLISSNDMDVTRDGVLFDVEADGNTISDNKIISTRDGIKMNRDSGFENDDNLLLNNVINSGKDGILIFGERNRAEGNTIRHGAGNGIVVDRSTDTELVKNEVHKKLGDGLVFLSSGTAEGTKVTQNDIWLNEGTPVTSDTAIELSVGGFGNWWHGDCGKGLFVPEEDSNALNVVDSNPYRHAVAHVPDPNEPKACPGN